MKPRALLLAGAALVFAAALAIRFGSESVSLREAWQQADSVDRLIFMQLRIPRVLLAALAGGALAMTGAALQALLRNPLADPFLLGVSGGSAVGASVAILFGLPALGFVGFALTPLAAAVGGLCATLLVVGFTRRKSNFAGSFGPEASGTLLLAGVMVNSIAGALIAFLRVLVAPERAQQLAYWLTGYLEARRYVELAWIAACILAAMAALLTLAAPLQVLALGPVGARAVGIDVARLERRVLLIASLLIGVVVSCTGLIGFVGLVVPQALRRLRGPDPRRLLPECALWGATLLVICDLLSRLLFRSLSTEPPVGAVTALVGGPLFLWLLRRPKSAVA